MADPLAQYMTHTWASWPSLLPYTRYRTWSGASFSRTASGTSRSGKTWNQSRYAGSPVRARAAQACSRATFNEDPSKCPAGSRVGTANAVTPTLPFQLPGTAYLVARNAALPTLEVVLSKDLVNIRLSSLIAYDKRYISTFENIPDAPVTSFQLDQPQGSHSSLTWTTGDICSHRLTMPTTFTGWDGRKISQTTRITAANCPVKIVAVRGLRGGKARVTLRIPEAVKARAEEKAAAAGQSLNTWMVGVVRSATSEHSINVDIDLSSVPFVGYDPFAANRRQGQGNNRRMTGWL